MHANLFDRYQQGHSPIHILDARVKVVVTLLFILGNVLLPDGAWLGFLLSFVLILFLCRLAQVPIWAVIKRSFIALPFALAAITTLFTIPGDTIATFSFGSWQLVITDAGLLRFTSIVVRSTLSVQMAILLTATTQFPDLIHALRHLRLPRILVAIISFMYRYLFILSDETLRLMRAREARSASLPGRPSGGSLFWRARTAGNMAGQLFVRSFDRSDRVYNAMLARGYRGHLYTLNPHAMARRDWLMLFLSLTVLLGIQVSGRLF